MVHPWITFDATSARERRCIEPARQLVHRRRRVLPMRILRPSTLQAIHQRERFESIVPLPWRRLFAIEEDQFLELIVEFYGSLECELPCTDLFDKYQGLHFRLGGRWRRLSIAGLALRLGIYTEEELSSEEFTEGLHDFADEEEKQEFWHEFADDDGREYVARRAKATKFRDPLHRVIHRAIFHTFSGRGDSEGNVTTRDLFHLFCLVRGYPCNLGISMAESFMRGVGSVSSSSICGGSYITALARSYGLLTDENLASLTLVAGCQEFDLAQLGYMNMLSTQRGISRLKDRRGRVWDPLPPAAVQEQGHGQGRGGGRGGRGGRGGGSGQEDVEMADLRQPEGDTPSFVPLDEEDMPQVPSVWQRLNDLQLG